MNRLPDLLDDLAEADTVGHALRRLAEAEPRDPIATINLDAVMRRRRDLERELGALLGVEQLDLIRYRVELFDGSAPPAAAIARSVARCSSRWSPPSSTRSARRRSGSINRRARMRGCPRSVSRTRRAGARRSTSPSRMTGCSSLKATSTRPSASSSSCCWRGRRRCSATSPPAPVSRRSRPRTPGPRTPNSTASPRRSRGGRRATNGERSRSPTATRSSSRPRSKRSPTMTVEAVECDCELISIDEPARDFQDRERRRRNDLREARRRLSSRRKLDDAALVHRHPPPRDPGALRHRRGDRALVAPPADPAGLTWDARLCA